MSTIFAFDVQQISTLSALARVTSDRELNVFRPDQNAKPAFSNPSGLKSVCEKLHFRDSVMWTLGLTVEKKADVQMSPAWSGRGLSDKSF